MPYSLDSTLGSWLEDIIGDSDTSFGISSTGISEEDYDLLMEDEEEAYSYND